ncbi:hypothetical protein JCM3774_002213 [Rhodotorula dairenensis]
MAFASSQELVQTQEESAVEAISKGHGFGVYSLEFQDHIMRGVKKVPDNATQSQRTKRFNKVLKSWDKKHPLAPDESDTDADGAKEAEEAERPVKPVSSETPGALPYPGSSSSNPPGAPIKGFKKQPSVAPHFADSGNTLMTHVKHQRFGGDAKAKAQDEAGLSTAPRLKPKHRSAATKAAESPGLPLARVVAVKPPIRTNSSSSSESE